MRGSGEKRSSIQYKTLYVSFGGAHQNLNLAAAFTSAVTSSFAG